MTAPMMPEQDDVLEKAKKLRAAGATIDQVKQYLQSKGYGIGEPPAVPRESLRLNIPKESTRVPSESTSALQRERPNASGDFQSLAPAVAANVLSAAQVVPGMEAFQATAGMVGSRMGIGDKPLSYKESLDALRSQTDAIPLPIKIAGQMAAGGPLLKALPSSPVATGALLGGADQVLDADPERGPGSRAVGGVLGATAGGAIGGVVDAGVTKLRSMKAEPSAKVIRSLKDTRAAETKPLFDAAILEGQGKTGTPEIAAFIAQPDVKDIIQGLKQTRKFANTAEDAPEMLDAVYKVLSDQGAAVKRGLDAVTPNRPNIGRYRGEDIRTAKDEALAAMDPVMPSMRPAIQTYAKRSGEINALRSGQDAMRTGLQKGVSTGKNLDRTSFEAFEDALAKMTPEERERAMQGILGATKQIATGTRPIAAARALSKAPGLLRATKTKEQQAIDALIKAALLGANTAIPH